MQYFYAKSLIHDFHKICTEIKVLFCIVLVKKVTTFYFFIFDPKKNYILTKMIELWYFYIPLNQCINMSKLTCKVWVGYILWSMYRQTDEITA